MDVVDRYDEFCDIFLEDENLKLMLGIDDGCRRIYGSLTNMVWKRIRITEDDLVSALSGQEYEWSSTFRTVGGLLAQWRYQLYGHSESYLDFYCCSPEGVVDEDVAKILKTYGWIPQERG